ncbi:hypothetical protein HPB48_011539 [Haemaphysalis longicornis]|uniref:Uncharacterized protein n=1 Tax=Haemaphysalis longicornis TaxID=44386 RepID=A0A9J6G9V3_HAELO|nr:hypothetical protein HPB48_011539 [Haemaphysalis longicornis]
MQFQLHTEGTELAERKRVYRAASHLHHRPIYDVKYIIHSSPNLKQGLQYASKTQHLEPSVLDTKHAVTACSLGPFSSRPTSVSGEKIDNSE